MKKKFKNIYYFLLILLIDILFFKNELIKFVYFIVYKILKIFQIFKKNILFYDDKIFFMSVLILQGMIVLRREVIELDYEDYMDVIIEV